MNLASKLVEEVKERQLDKFNGYEEEILSG